MPSNTAAARRPAMAPIPIAPARAPTESVDRRAPTTAQHPTGQKESSLCGFAARGSSAVRAQFAHSSRRDLRRSWTALFFFDRSA